MSSALATQPESAPVARSSQPRLTNNALLTAAGGVLLLGPLAFGAVEPWSIFALEASAMLLLAVWASRQWINRELNFSDNVLYRPMAAFFALVLAIERFPAGSPIRGKLWLGDFELSPENSPDDAHDDSHENSAKQSKDPS